MSPVRTLVLALGFTLATLAFGIGPAFAQTGSPNPTGGTWCRPTTGDAVSNAPSTITAGLSIDLLVHRWVATLIARQVVSVERSGVAVTARAVKPRRLPAR